METASQQHVIVFNGEIYNHSILRGGMREVPFSGHSDTETILHAIARRGIGAVRDFNGIFALAFLDRGQEKLYLARDPFGVKPLYYCQSGDTLVFSSEIKPVQALVRDEISPENLAELLRLRFSPSPDTLFKNIRKVRPGHVLEVDLKGPRLTMREYPFAAVPQPGSSLSFEAAVSRYGELFEQAVERQLMSDVEVGVLLSGGVDSALVAAFAQKRSGRPLKAFTVGFLDQDDSDEVADAAETAAYLGMDHHVTRIGFDDFLNTVKNCVGIVEEPVATTSVIPMFYLSELVSGHLKVVLSGQGADEYLGGYGRYQGEIYARLLPSFIVKCLQPLVSAAGVKNAQLLRGVNTLRNTDDQKRFLEAYSVFAPDEIKRLIGFDDLRSESRISYLYEVLGCSRMTEAVERMMSLDMRLNLADDLLLYTDKITMHHSIECRVPMLDLNLVRFVESLPYHYRVRLRRGKIIHKAFAQKALPASIIHRKKKGFQSPTRHWFSKDNVVRDILLDRSSRFSAYFDNAEVTRVLDEHAKGFNRDRHIFLLLSLYYWMERYA